MVSGGRCSRFLNVDAKISKVSHLVQIVIYVYMYLSVSDVSAVGHLDPRLPLREVVQDLHTVVQIQRRERALDHAEYTGPNRLGELDHTRSGIYVP